MAQHWLLATLVATALALVPPATTAPGLTKLSAYVPSGMSAAEWKKIQDKEKQQRTGKNFGAGGARGFKSRSFNSFVDAMERGEATHLFAVNPDEVRKGNIALKDVPYMQRGGSWDNSDLKGKKGWMKTGFGMTAYNDGKAEQKRELASDKKYNNIKPDIGFFGEALNWGGGAKGDDLAARAKKNGLTNDQQMWRDSGALSQQEIKRMNSGRRMMGAAPKINTGGQKAPEKKFFGLF
mmetsp:Transcript_20868/g.54374  ORF Transcript_20868/g.54374 Transcript_20868/m.54374 type:complete len:237 (+) Transcript_20868:200-910(+)